MYYVSSIRDNNYYITDTKDNVTKAYSYEQIVDIVDNVGLTIIGVDDVCSPYRIKEFNYQVTGISDLAKSFTVLDKCLLEMGYSHSVIVESLCSTLIGDTTIYFYDLDSDILDDLSNYAYQVHLDKKDPILREIVDFYVSDEYENYNAIKRAMIEENVDSINKSEIFRASYCIYKFIAEYDKNLAKKVKEDLLDGMNKTEYLLLG